MADSLKKCDFFLLRYAPDALREEFVNIGVVLLDGSSGFADVRLTQDWRRVRCLDPAVSIEVLQAMEAEIRERLRAGGEDRDRILHVLQNSFSNTVQVTSPKGCETASPEQEIERLVQLYVEPKRRPSVRDNAGRGAILGRMRDAFQQAGVWQMMRKKIAAADYTYKGDPLKIDCGYRPNGVIHFIQAMPLANGAEAAKALAFSYPQIVEGVARVEAAGTELTAVVEDDLDRKDDEVAFAVDILQRNSIVVAQAGELARLAEQARMELRV
jgi:hypothetical protein